jgi:hypothetical protein
MSQPHLSNNLDKIIQMISIEQLLGLMKQMKSNDTDPNTNTNNDILSLPIVKNVINAYEQEIKALNATTNTKSDIPFASEITKITEQLDKINNNLLFIVEKINSMESDFKSMQNNKQVGKLNDDEEHIKLKIEEKDIKDNDAFESINIADDDCESDCSDDEFIKEIKASLAKMEKEEIEDELESKVEEKEVVSKAEAIEDEVEASEVDDDTEPEISDDSDEDVKEVVKEVKQLAQADEEEDEEEDEDEEADEEEEEEEEEEESAQAEAEEEEEEEVFEIEIDDVTYYATHEENGILYEVDKDGEVGKKVGIIRDGEPIFS